MKTNKQILILFLIMLIGAPILSAQSKKEYNPEVIEKIVASGYYKLNVGTYMPPSGEYIELDYPENSIEIKNDSVFSDLFFVEESDIPYSGRGNELRFQVPLKKYTMDIDRKGNTHINFSVRTKVDKFNFKVVVYLDGRAIVNVFMQHHQNHFRSYDSFSRNAGIRS